MKELNTNNPQEEKNDASKEAKQKKRRRKDIALTAFGGISIAANSNYAPDTVRHAVDTMHSHVGEFMTNPLSNSLGGAAVVAAAGAVYGVKSMAQRRRERHTSLESEG